MIIHLGLPLLTSSSGLPGNPIERERSRPAFMAGLFPYLTLLRVEIARFTLRRVPPFGQDLLMASPLVEAFR